jgi:hypothetical protein
MGMRATTERRPEDGYMVEACFGGIGLFCIYLFAFHYRRHTPHARRNHVHTGVDTTPASGSSPPNTHLPITTLLHLPKPQRPQHLSPESIRRIHKRQFVVVDGSALPDQIDFHGLQEAGALDEFPGEEGDWGCLLEEVGQYC